MFNFQAKQVWLAPMSGATDAAMRRQAVKFGAPAVVSEMVAGEMLVSERKDVVRRTCRHEGDTPWIVQLAARRPEDMQAASEILVGMGVGVIDINMGCPSRQVTGGLSGSALMKDIGVAEAIIDAALEGASGLPVTLKMRLGWDDDSLNAPEIAAIAEAKGIRLITVHGRTRCQFYKGHADWKKVRDTVDRVNVPVIVNGDIGSVDQAETAQRESGAFGVMIGRAAIGRPWIVGQIAAHLEGCDWSAPSLDAQCDSLCEQIEDSCSLYGEELGARIVRKHISAAIEYLDLPIADEQRRRLKSEICQLSTGAAATARLRSLYAGSYESRAA